MKDIPISNRLKTVAQFIPSGARIADIGSDHAYLPCYAYLQGIIQSGIAGEVKVGPFHSAKETIEKYNLSRYISARLGDGLSVIEKNEVDTITIAGMGGELIVRILDEGEGRLTGRTRLILQPNKAEKHVRRSLTAKGWTIIDETILEEDRHTYEIIVAEKKDKVSPLTEEAIMFGPWLMKKKGETFIEKWKWELQKKEQILQSLHKAAALDAEIEARIRKVMVERDRIKEVLN